MKQLRAACRSEYALAHEAGLVPAKMPEALTWVLNQEIGMDQEGFAHRVSVEEEIALLVVADERAMLFSVIDEDAGKVTHLGSLQGGIYSETVRRAESAYAIEVRYDHERIPGGSLRANTIVPIGDNARYTVYLNQEELIMRGDSLREALRALGSLEQ